MGPTTAETVRQLAGNLVQLARVKRGLSQRELATLAGVPQPMIARIEAYRQQPTLPTLCRILAAADLELRIGLADCDDHGDVLDERRVRLSEEERRAADEAQRGFLDALRASARA